MPQVQPVQDCSAARVGHTEQSRWTAATPGSGGVRSMGRPERPVDPNDGPVQRFAYALWKLRQEEGGPTCRQMARRAHYSATALSQANSRRAASLTRCRPGLCEDSRRRPGGVGAALEGSERGIGAHGSGGGGLVAVSGTGAVRAGRPRAVLRPGRTGRRGQADDRRAPFLVGGAAPAGAGAASADAGPGPDGGTAGVGTAPGLRTLRPRTCQQATPALLPCARPPGHRRAQPDHPGWAPGSARGGIPVCGQRAHRG